MSITTERPLTVSQVADILGVAPSTVVNYCEAGKLAHWRLPSGHRRFRRAAVDQFLEEHFTPGGAA